MQYITIGAVELGVDVEIFPGAIIGCPAESYDRESLETPIIIGHGTTIRENVVIQRGLDRQTVIGAGCYIMHGCHIAHDCVVGDRVTLAPLVVLGGNTTIFVGANLGIHSATHQYVTIGHYAMVGMGAMVIDDVPPGELVRGVPARGHGINAVGLGRHGMTPEDLNDLHPGYDEVRRRPREVLPAKEA